MRFKTIPGIEGKVFIPDDAHLARKHPCGDCFACQQCSDDRCRVCRADGPPAVTGANGPCRNRRSGGKDCPGR